MFKINPSSKIARICVFVGFSALLLITVGGVLFFQMNKVFSADLASEESWPYISSEAKGDHKDYEAKFAAILERHPDLKPEWKDVPDEGNGFLHLLQLYEYVVGVNGIDKGNTLAFTEEFRKEFSDSSISKEDFGDGDQYQPLIMELDRIAAMDQRSCYGIDPNRVIMWKANVLRDFTYILIYDACNAAERGDKDQALSRVRAAVRIVDHFSQIETVPLIGHTVALSSDHYIYKTVFDEIFPKLNLDQSDYGKWRQALVSEDQDITLSDLSKGEFNLATPVITIPIVERIWLYKIFGSDKVYDGIAEMYLKLDGLSRESYSLYLQEGFFEKELQGQRRATAWIVRPLLGALEMGWKPYMQGCIRMMARFRQYDAALACLAGEEMPVELLTGKPFLYDEEESLLYSVDEPVLYEVDLKPVHLPLVK